MKWYTPQAQNLLENAKKQYCTSFVWSNVRRLCQILVPYFVYLPFPFNFHSKESAEKIVFSVF